MTGHRRRIGGLALLALSIAGCASQPDGTGAKPLSLDEKLAEAGYKLGDKVDRIQTWAVNGWQRIDDEHVVFDAGPSRDYLVTVLPPCSGLASAQTIGFTATGSQITTFDKLVVRDIGFTDNCRISALNELKRLKKR
jgi:hypothetical protein